MPSMYTIVNPKVKRHHQRLSKKRESTSPEVPRWFPNGSGPPPAPGTARVGGLTDAPYFTRSDLSCVIVAPGTESPALRASRTAFLSRLRSRTSRQ